MNKPTVTHFMYIYYFPPLATSSCTPLSEYWHHNTVHCWCHKLVCQLHGKLLIPYPTVPSVRCTVGAITRCAFCHPLQWTVRTIPLSAVLFHTIPNFPTHPNTKPDTLPHKGMLSTKWGAISLRRVIQRRLSPPAVANCSLTTGRFPLPLRRHTF